MIVFQMQNKKRRKKIDNEIQGSLRNWIIFHNKVYAPAKPVWES
jgi:hypothetical protein